MMISRLHRPLSLTLATLGLISLVACGGGGSSNKPPVVVDDTTPNAFSFTAAEGAEPNAVITSPTATISGINTATPISISGGEYSIAGGAFTSTAGTITNGQTLTVRVTASDKTNTPKEATITVGGVSAKFVVTTLADTTPDAFSFTAKKDVDVNTEYTSEAVTVKGIDIAVPVSITGGLYSINGGEFTSAAGTVSVEQTIVVKTTSGAITDATQNAVLTIGDVSGTFTVSTIPDTTPPIAEFKFPTPYTMSEAMSVKVRGTATDDHAITSLKVVVNGAPGFEVTPTAPGDYSSWTATVSLAENSENEIKVVAMDDRGNVTQIDAAKKVVVRQRLDYSGVFPDSGSPIESTTSLLLDKSRDRLLYSHGSEVFSEIDITSAVSKTYINFGTQFQSSFGMGVIDSNAEYAYLPSFSGESILKLSLKNPDVYSIHTDDKYGRQHRAITINRSGVAPLLISTQGRAAEGNVIKTNLNNWETTILSSVLLAIPDSTVPFGSVTTVVFDQKNNRYLLCDSQLDAVVAVDALTGKRTIFSNDSTGSGDAYGLGEDDRIKTIGLDEPRNRLIVSELSTGFLYAVDLDTAERSIISKMTLTHPTSDVWPDNEKNYIGAEIDTENELLYTVHHRVKALMVVDLQSGQQLVLSKAVN